MTAENGLGPTLSGDIPKLARQINELLHLSLPKILPEAVNFMRIVDDLTAEERVLLGDADPNLGAARWNTIALAIGHLDEGHLNYTWQRPVDQSAMRDRLDTYLNHSNKKLGSVNHFGLWTLHESYLQPTQLPTNLIESFVDYHDQARLALETQAITTSASTRSERDQVIKTNPFLTRLIQTDSAIDVAFTKYLQTFKIRQL